MNRFKPDSPQFRPTAEELIELKAKIDSNEDFKHLVRGNNLYLIEYTKNGKEGTFQVPSDSELNAVVRLGQIYGDDKDWRDDVVINVLSIKKVG